MKTKGRWDWRVLLLARPGTRSPDIGGVVSLLALLASKCDKNFRIVTLDRRECVVTYCEPTNNDTFQRELIALAKAANLQLRPVDADNINWPKPAEVRQFVGPRYLEADVFDALRGLLGATQVVLDSRGGQILRVFAAWSDELTDLAASFQRTTILKNGGWKIFTPGLRPRGMRNGGISFLDFASAFHPDQLEPGVSPVSVRVGTVAGGTPVFVDAGKGHALIMGPSASEAGRLVANGLAQKAVEAGKFVIVFQPKPERSGALAQMARTTISTRMDDDTITALQTGVLAEPGLTVIQGGPGGGTLEKLYEILEGLWAAAQTAATHRDDWPGLLLVFDDFTPTTSEGPTGGRTLPPERHRMYELLAEMVSVNDGIGITLLSRPEIIYETQHLRAVIANFGAIVRLPTPASGSPRSEIFSRDRDTNAVIEDWLHTPGTNRALVFGPAGWLQVTLEEMEVPEVSVAAKGPQKRAPTSGARQWAPQRQRPRSAAPIWTPTAKKAPLSTEKMRGALKVLGWLPLTREEREAEEERAAAATKAKAEEPACKTPLTAGERKKLKPIIDLVDRLVEKGIEPPDLARMLRTGVSRKRFEDFLDGTLSEEDLRAPADAAQQRLEEKAQNLKAADKADLEQVLGIKLL